ncbi:MAG: hypothetical protein ACE5D6_04790 [Candidatus Zixiibacteriota bacterium]
MLPFSLEEKSQEHGAPDLQKLDLNLIPLSLKTQRTQLSLRWVAAPNLFGVELERKDVGLTISLPVEIEDIPLL